jgi:hypothetical protein
MTPEQRHAQMVARGYRQPGKATHRPPEPVEPVEPVEAVSVEVVAGKHHAPEPVPPASKYRCRRHPDQRVNFRGHGCKTCAWPPRAVTLRASRGAAD